MNYSKLNLTPLFQLFIVLGLLWGLHLALGTTAWASGETCPNGTTAPCSEDVQLNGCVQCHSMRVTGGNRNGTDRIITASGGADRHIDDPKASDWTSIVGSMISKGAASTLVLTAGYLNTNYCLSCNGAILGSPVPSSVTQATATITWSTSASGFEDEPSDTVLFYGTNQADVLLGPGCSSCTNVSNSTSVGHHVVNLTGLSPKTTYYLVNQATSFRGTVKSKYAVSFKTKSAVTGGIPSLVYLTGYGSSPPGVIGVIDPATNTQIATIPGTNRASTFQMGELAAVPEGTVVYALDGSSSSGSDLDVVDVLTNNVAGKVILAGTNLVVVSPDGKKAYVTQSGQINVIDTSSNVRIDTITIPCTNSAVQNGRLGLGIHPSGSLLYLTCARLFQEITTGYFYLIDPVTKVVTQTATFSSVYTNSLVKDVGVYNGLAVHPNGTRVYQVKDSAGNNATIEYFDGATGLRLGAIPLISKNVRSVVVSPDGNRLYTSSNSGLLVINAASNSIITTLAQPEAQALKDLALTPDGKHLYGTKNTASVSVIDLVTNTVTQTIPLSGINKALAITISSGRAGAGAPDLLMTQVTANTSSGDSGQTLSITDTVKNQGAASSGSSFTIAYRFSPTSNYDSPGAVVATTIRSVSTLEAGATDMITTSLSIPTALTPGNYYVCAKADSDDVVAESKEANNTLCSGSTVQLDSPDLVMTLESPKASSVAMGEVLLVTDTVKNQGGASTESSFTIGYQLSPTADYDHPNAVLLPTIRWVGNLAPAASDTADRALLIPQTILPGSYFVCAKADPGDTIPESNKNNNTLCSSSPIAVQ